MGPAPHGGQLRAGCAMYSMRTAASAGYGIWSRTGAAGEGGLRHLEHYLSIPGHSSTNEEMLSKRTPAFMLGEKTSVPAAKLGS